jgi:hypothetical protein
MTTGPEIRPRRQLFAESLPPLPAKSIEAFLTALVNRDFAAGNLE